MAALPGLAAVIALIFTWQSINATNAQLQISEQGQITDRYNAAITNLGSPSVDVRLGGIYALQRIMRDSPRDQPTIVAVLCAFVRDHSKLPAGDSPTSISPVTTDVQTALTVVGTRNTANDGDATVVDFSDSNLDSADLGTAELSRANLTDANLTDANLGAADLDSANLNNANLTGAEMFGTAPSATRGTRFLIGANLASASLYRANLTRADLGGTNLDDADLEGANLKGADLNGANLTMANLEKATHADLTDSVGKPAYLPNGTSG